MDETDRRLLRLLQKDGRMTNVDLARQAHLSQTAALERVRRLQRDGVIEGFTAILNPVALDRGLLVFVELVLERTNAGVFADFAEAV
jgi:Lrp/AsnC family leucine-responsive transcriptional regulator